MEEIRDLEEKLQALGEFIDNLDEDDDEGEGMLVTTLHRAQLIFGYIPVVVQNFIAEKLDKTPAEVYGVITFYPFFRTSPIGKHIIGVCTGTACFMKGANELTEEFSRLLKIKVGETTADGLFTLQTKRCVGACHLAPVVLVDDDVFGKVEKSEIKDIISKYRG